MGGLRLLQEAGVQICTLSPFIRTAPQGFVSPNYFLNGAVACQSTLSPEQLLRLTQEIERQLGRTRKSSPTAGYADRPLDLDILLYGSLVLRTPHLILPHPRMAERRFVLEPLSLIAPGLIHPVLHKPIAQLLAELP